MTVLPKEATLVSFGILLVIVLIFTVILASNLRNIFSMFLRGQQMASGLVYSSIQRSSKVKWENSTRTPSGPRKDILSGDVQTAGDILSILAVLYNSLIALPAHEVAYALTLLKPVRAAKLPWYMEVHFSGGKFLGDLVRLLLLPMWIVLALPHWAVLGVKCLHRVLQQRGWIHRNTG